MNQAQIEAANDLVGKWFIWLWATRPPWLKEMPDQEARDNLVNRIVALTAAAEAWEQRNDPSQGGPTSEQFNNIVNAAIERCAQWHDEQEKLFRSNQDPDYQMVADWHHNSAAAIRALKP